MAAILETADEDETPDSAYWLPAIARTEIESWVRVAFTRWRLTAPEVFPETAEWRKSDEWASPAELTARQELASFETEEARHQAQAVIVREQLSRRVRATDSEGEAWRALVSSTGEDLVQAVNKTLQMIGFQVIDSDTLPQHKGKKREDLRVVDGDWTALVEVKGYGGAAKSNDLQQLTAASTVFAAAERKVPDALWYVVNVHRFIDPAQRELALPSREDDLAAFAESHSGALIDVRDLFKLRQLVAAQTMSPTEARNRLKHAIRRFRPLNPMSSEDTEG